MVVLTKSPKLRIGSGQLFVIRKKTVAENRHRRCSLFFLENLHEKSVSLDGAAKFRQYPDRTPQVRKRKDGLLKSHLLFFQFLNKLTVLF